MKRFHDGSNSLCSATRLDEVRPESDWSVWREIRGNCEFKIGLGDGRTLNSRRKRQEGTGRRTEGATFHGGTGRDGFARYYVYPKKLIRFSWMLAELAARRAKAEFSPQEVTISITVGTGSTDVVERAIPAWGQVRFPHTEACAKHQNRESDFFHGCQFWKGLHWRDRSFFDNQHQGSSSGREVHRL